MANKLELFFVVFKKNIFWVCVSIMRLRVLIVFGDMFIVGFRFKVDKIVFLICKKVLLVNYRKEKENFLKI